MPPDGWVLIRGQRVHVIDEQGRAIEVTGPERELLLAEAAIARLVREAAREMRLVRGGQG